MAMVMAGHTRMLTLMDLPFFGDAVDIALFCTF
jgi:hypothetical protein